MKRKSRFEKDLDRSLEAMGALHSLAKALEERLGWEALGLDLAEERRVLESLGEEAREVLHLLGGEPPSDPLEALRALGAMGKEMERRRARGQEVDGRIAGLKERLETLHSQATEVWLRIGAKRDEAYPPSLEELRALLG